MRISPREEIQRRGRTGEGRRRGTQAATAGVAPAGPTTPITRYGFVKQLRLRPDSKPRYIRVTLYDNVEQLRRDADRTSHGQKHPEANGVFQPSGTIWGETEDGSWAVRWDSYAGHMRLWREFIEPRVIAHESLHAALAMWRYETELRIPDLGSDVPDDAKGIIDRGIVRLGEDCDADEEALCYLMDAIVDGVHTLLREFGE